MFRTREEILEEPHQLKAEYCSGTIRLESIFPTSTNMKRAQSSGLRCLNLAADIIEKRFRCFLTPDMARRSSQRFAASFYIDGKQFVNLSHNWGRNWNSLTA